MRKALIKKVLPLLKILKHCPDIETRNSVLAHLSEESIDVICEIIHNCLHNHKKISLETPVSLKSQLEKHKTNLRFLAKPRAGRGLKKRRQILSQTGEGIGTILSIALPFLADLLFRK